MQKVFSSLTAVLTVLVLTAGVAFGVTLVKQSQDYRNQAAELKEHKTTICHKTGSDSNPWVQIEVSDNSVESHLSHGDIQGNCPESGNNNGNNGNNNTNANSNASGGINSVTNVTVNNQTVAAAEVKVETKYVFITTQFDFLIKFQGIESKKPEKTVRVIFRNGDEELHVYNKVQVVADAKGIYHGRITDVRPGVYEVLIKGNGYLQKKFENINLKRGANKNDWSKFALIAGDFDGNNIISSKDFADFLSFYNEELNPIAGDNKIFDVNMDGKISDDDLLITVKNYNNLSLSGEN